MPTESNYAKLDIPNVDIWTFLFERKKLNYPQDKGILCGIRATKQRLRVSSHLHRS